MPALTLSLLGGFRARLDDRWLTLSKKAQALLAHLALSPGQTQPRTRLAGLLWGDRADEQARNSLRQTLFELRRVLGPAGEGCLIADHERVALNPINLSVDVLELEGAAGEDTLAAFERAAALYGGELLAGRLGVALADALIAERGLEDDGRCYRLMPAGTRSLCALGIDVVVRDAPARRCLDWTERRPHVAGPVGTALAKVALDRGWVRRLRGTRAVAVTPPGRMELKKVFNLRWEEKP